VRLLSDRAAPGRLEMRFLPTIAAKPVASKKIVPGSGVATMNCPPVKAYPAGTPTTAGKKPNVSTSLPGGMFRLNRLPSGSLPPTGEVKLAGMVTVKVKGEFFPIGSVKLAPAVIGEPERTLGTVSSRCPPIHSVNTE